MRFLDHAQFDTSHSVGLLWVKGSARRGDLYLTIHKIHNRKTSMPPARFELPISASKLP